MYARFKWCVGNTLKDVTDEVAAVRDMAWNIDVRLKRE